MDKPSIEPFVSDLFAHVISIPVYKLVRSPRAYSQKVQLLENCKKPLLKPREQIPPFPFPADSLFEYSNILYRSIQAPKSTSKAASPNPSALGMAIPRCSL